MADNGLSNWLQSISERYGFEASGGTSSEPEVCEDVRPSEVISGSSSSQYSYGGNTNESASEGGDFGDRSRENALADDGSTSNPMQSPDLDGGTFTLRYGIGFLCANYNTWSNLSDVAGYASPTSTYRQAFSGMDRTNQFQNPTSAAILAGIGTWVQNLSDALNGCGQGELVVSFQGHGQGGNIYGVDEQAISPSDLSALARTAEASRVSITYILDACESGGAVPEFQNHSADRVDDNVDDTEGAGLVCSQENEDMAEALRDQMAHARTLIQMNEAIARRGSALVLAADAVDNPSPNTAAAVTAAWTTVSSLNTTVTQEIEQMQAQFLNNMDFGSDPEMRLGTIEGAFTAVLSALNGITQASTTNLHVNWAGKVGTFQDTISDGANRIIQLANRRAQEYSSR